MFERKWFTVHSEGDHCVAAVGCSFERETTGVAIDRPPDDLVGTGLHAGFGQQIVEAHAEPAWRCRPGSPPIVFDTQVSVMSYSTTLRVISSSKVNVKLLVDHAGDP